MAVINILQAINASLKEEMQKDDRIVVLGEDVGRLGGVFRVTDGLLKEFGENRVIDTPLSETGIIGISIGMAIYGLIPIAEIQFQDFIFTAFEEIVNHLAKMRYRSGGQFTAHVVIRTPYGGGVKGGHYHSQSGEAYFAHTAGLKVVIPSTPYDAKGLLKAAIRDQDPVIFMEPKKIYRAIKEEVPDDDYIVPLGKSRIVKEGYDVSIYSYGAMVHVALEAAELASREGYNVEIIDLRTLIPLDIQTIINSVKKTGRAIILHEAPKTLGFGAEISALISEKAIEYLKAPIIRVTGFDTPFPYTLENLYMPNAQRVLKAIKHVMSY
ncbi:MAG: alpha-ketoacid dehydrogenase subunit beta [Thermoprotei archaeon]